MLLQMAGFISFLWLNDIPLCVHAVYHLLSIFLSVDIGCFHIFAIAGNAAVNTGVQIYPQHSVSVTLGSIP